MYENQGYQFTDVFALGMVAYEVLAGASPFPDVGSDKIPSFLQSGRRPDLAKLPAQYTMLVERCLEPGLLLFVHLLRHSLDAAHLRCAHLGDSSFH